jgi:microcystin-dependent protein
MADVFLGQITVYSFLFAPKGFAMCNGQIMSIQQNAALFALLGTTYGGNGQSTFALPNLQGKVPMHMGQSPISGGFYQLGQTGGEESHTLTTGEIAHNHPVKVHAGNANQRTPVGNVYANVQGTQTNVYSTGAANTNMGGGLTNTGSSQAHSNMAPYLTLTMCIALQGIFPSRN